MIRLRRRDFVIAAGVTALAATAGGYALLRDDGDPRRRMVLEALQIVLDEFFPTTRIAAADLDAFATDFARRNGRTLRDEVLAANGRFDAPRRADIHALFEHRVVQAFLISTDYFEREAAGEHTVHFMRPSDPYTAGCGNPVAQFGFD